MGRIYLSTDKSVPRAVSKYFDQVKREIDEKGMLRRRAPISEIKLVHSKAFSIDEPLTIKAIANLAKRDRWDEVVVPEAYAKRLPVFLQNPILLREHDRNHPIGRCLSVTPKKDGLHYEGIIGEPALYPLTLMQIETRSLIIQQILKMNSIGFIPHLIEYDEDEEEIRHTDVELLEISIVAIPMQQDSSIQDIKHSGKGTKMGKKAPGARGKSEEEMENEEEEEEGASKANEPTMADLKAAIDEVNQHSKGCHEILKGMQSSDDAKSLRTELTAAKAKIADLTKRNTELEAELEDVNRKALELLENINNSGTLKS